jgi:hypothetical protein
MSWAVTERRRVLGPIVLPACPSINLGYVLTRHLT